MYTVKHDVIMFTVLKLHKFGGLNENYEQMKETEFTQTPNNIGCVNIWVNDFKYILVLEVVVQCVEAEHMLLWYSYPALAKPNRHILLSESPCQHQC